MQINEQRFYKGCKLEAVALKPLNMPTPFYHLHLAQELLADTACPQSLHDEAGAFYLGNIAPDAQNIAGLSRESTHFFEVPLRDSTPAWDTMFNQYPSLTETATLTPPQHAFLAGYICHLAVDQMWIANIFDPVFVDEAKWENPRERFFIHNVLRIYLDELDRPALATHGVGASLLKAQPDHWLPFLTDAALAQWRDFVAEQLLEGGAAQTLEVFAKRMNRPPHDFESLLHSPTQMSERVFHFVSIESLNHFRRQAFARSRAVIAEYLSG